MSAVARELSRWERAGDRLVATRAGAWFMINVAGRLDPLLLRATGGRVAITMTKPTLLLTTTGAKSGQPRQATLVYTPDGDRIVLVGSRGGDSRHPAWVHNLRAHPEVEVLARGRSGRYVAREAEGEERERLWRAASGVYTGYDTYQARAGSRQIPVVVLEPA